jgi:hypothetical protein
MKDIFIRALEDFLGGRVLDMQTPDCGLSAAIRMSVSLRDGSRVFVKAATDEETAGWLRREHFVLSSVAGPFMPSVIGWLDEGLPFPALMTQDLSHAYWPASHQGVHWRPGDVERVIEATTRLGLVGAPLDLPPVAPHHSSLWRRISTDFLRLDLCSEQWFAASIDALVEAERKVDVGGDSLVHGDVRSDNLCILHDRVIFVDWSHAARGNRRQDLAHVLPTLHLEGGPSPYEVMPDGGPEASALCAMHAARLLSDTGMPGWLKGVFVRLIGIELEWAGRCLGLL